MIALAARGGDVVAPATAQDSVVAQLAAQFHEPPPAARPWVFWYWVNAAVSPEGITADLEAMRDAGLAGAYLMPIKGPADPPLMEPPVVQLSPEWWEMVKHAAREADRLGLKLGFHACDGFATAGGPWITPELSMQKLVWTTTHADGGRPVDVTLPQPEANEGYYRDLAVFAFPALPGAGVSSGFVRPTVTTSEVGFEGGFLASGGAKPQAEGRRWRCEGPGWVQYAFDEPFVARSLTVWPDGANYSSMRLRIEASDDGAAWGLVAQLEAPRHGWQNGEAPLTYALPETTARRYRFVFEPRGTEPGAEDLDSAKWSAVLKICGLELSSEPRIHQFEGKSGAVWRVAARTTAEQVPDDVCVPRAKIVDVTRHLEADGRLRWTAPAGRWTILRVGHTSTGQRNETGGGGCGLECDKLSAEAARVQFDGWFGEILRQLGQELADRVVTKFHVDSWECGGQNWTPAFRAEFQQRRGYDPLPWLAAMAGVPVESAAESERFLQDMRQTISELMVDNFYGTLAGLAHEHGCEFTAECTAPTFAADGMAHFANVDVPMGEFWLRSPTHDKPSDMRDAISAAHIYGKPVVQAEAFTELRMAWDEHPGMLRSLGDRQFALGANRLVPHVWVHNPWLDRRPGATLDGVGLYFQRDQTWAPFARAWVDYLARCQTLLQFGRPVVDVAVFTGEELPRRAVLAERLIDSLPGLLGAEAVSRERRRLANEGQPQREAPAGVRASANITDPQDWFDPLRGYAFDSINRDALLLAEVRDGRAMLPGEMSYSVLVLPGRTAMDPAGDGLSAELLAKLKDFAANGAAVIVPRSLAPLQGERVVAGPYRADSLTPMGVSADFVARVEGGEAPTGVAWAHRAGQGVDVYFVSNQSDEAAAFQASLRLAGRTPELWDPVTGDIGAAAGWREQGGRTLVPMELAPRQSLFIVLRERPDTDDRARVGPDAAESLAVAGPWRVRFEASSARPQAADNGWELEVEDLFDWAGHDERRVRYFSGTAVYETNFTWDAADRATRRAWIDLGRVANLAEVTLNGVPCGVAWTPPFRVDVTRALRNGENQLRVAIANTWHNQLIGDAQLPETQRETWTTAPAVPKSAELSEAGLFGPVRLVVE